MRLKTIGLISAQEEYFSRFSASSLSNQSLFKVQSISYVTDVRREMLLTRSLSKVSSLRSIDINCFLFSTDADIIMFTTDNKIYLYL